MKGVPANWSFLKDQPLLRLPHELARRNFKTVQRIVEREKEYVIPALKESANASLSGKQDPTQALASLDTMITRMQGLKRKMETLQEEERSILSQSRKRIEHLEDLFGIQSLVDVKYERWSKTRLNRLLVDHMLRSGYLESAKQLAHEEGLEDLVDVHVFAQCQRIAESLRRGETKEALQWCGENKVALKKLHVCFFSLFIVVYGKRLLTVLNRISWNLNYGCNSILKCYVQVREQKQGSMPKNTLHHTVRHTNQIYSVLPG